MSRPDQLVSMTNQIAAFFVVQPGDAAPQRIADHLVSFWPPRMRDAIIAHLHAGGGGLVPSARRAIELLATRSEAQVEAEAAALGEPSPAHQPGDDAG